MLRKEEKSEKRKEEDTSGAGGSKGLSPRPAPYEVRNPRSVPSVGHSWLGDLPVTLSILMRC